MFHIATVATGVDFAWQQPIHHRYIATKPGWICQRGSPSSSAALMTSVLCMYKHHGTSPITSLQLWKLHLDIGYVPPTDTGSLCLAVDSTHTVVGSLFRLLVRLSETHCQMNSEIRRVTVILTASNSSLKQSCSAFTSATSTIPH